MEQMWKGKLQLERAMRMKEDFLWSDSVCRRHVDGETGKRRMMLARVFVCNDVISTAVVQELMLRILSFSLCLLDVNGIRLLLLSWIQAQWIEVGQQTDVTCALIAYRFVVSGFHLDFGSMRTASPPSTRLFPRTVSLTIRLTWRVVILVLDIVWVSFLLLLFCFCFLFVCWFFSATKYILLLYFVNCCIKQEADRKN